MSYELIISIINRGFSDDVMEAARNAGAGGGTIIHAHGAGAHEAEKLFGITIHPEKELMLILVQADVRNAVMTAISQKAGLGTEGAGITFSLPVGDVLGIARGMKKQEEMTTPEQSKEQMDSE